MEKLAQQNNDQETRKAPIKELLKQPRSEERNAQIKEFIENLAHQRIGIAKMQEEILQEVENGGREIDFYKIRNIFMKYAAEYQFTGKQTTIIHSMITNAENRNRIVSAIMEKYKTPDELYEHVYNIKPEGYVAVKSGPVSIAFLCESDNDYKRIYASNFSGSGNPTGAGYYAKHFSDQAEKSAGVFTFGSPYGSLIKGGMIIGARMNEKVKNPLEEIIKHEEQHALNNIYNLKINYIKKDIALNELWYEQDPEKIRSRVRDICNGIIYNAGLEAQDEIVAYCVQNEEINKNNIVENLTNNEKSGEAYSYFNTEVEIKLIMKACDRFKAEEKQVFESEARNILEDGYRKLIEKGITCFEILKMRGHTNEEIVALLMPEPLKHWPKVVHDLEKRYSVGINSETLRKIESIKKSLVA